jgi:hypothetical protein
MPIGNVKWLGCAALVPGMMLGACVDAPDERPDDARASAANATRASIDDTRAALVARAELGWTLAVDAPDATHFVVDRGDDSQDGACVADGDSRGGCNLRAALAAAQASAGPVTVALAVDSLVDGGEIALGAGGVAQRIDVVAEDGARIDGVRRARLFTVAAGVTLALHGVLVENFAAQEGGAIFNHGELVLEGTTFSDNTARCSGVGAQTAFASCSGGAIASDGRLAIGPGSRFEANTVVAAAYTAAFTTSAGHGGAIASSGEIVVDGPVAFANNSVSATSFSGEHPLPFGGAEATAEGGAIYSSGSLSFRGPVPGGCRFDDNAARAQATSSHATPGAASSTGGAIYTTAASPGLVMPDGACTFQGNQALSDRDVHRQP